MYRLSLALTALVALTACPSDDDATCEDLCTKMDGCADSDHAECISQCTAEDLKYSNAGMDSTAMLDCMIGGYSCAMSDEQFATLILTCAAGACGQSGSCSAEDAPACCGDGIVLCLGEEWAGLTCGDVCQMSDMTYAGTCGTEFQGQQSSTGNDVCWCYE